MTLTIYQAAYLNSQVLPPKPRATQNSAGSRIQLTALLFAHTFYSAESEAPVSLHTQRREASWAAPVFALFQKSVPDCSVPQAVRLHGNMRPLNNLGKPMFPGLQAPGPTQVMISQDEPLLKSPIRHYTHLWGVWGTLQGPEIALLPVSRESGDPKAADLVLWTCS